jgi:hypothetical protein
MHLKLLNTQTLTEFATNDFDTRLLLIFKNMMRSQCFMIPI